MTHTTWPENVDGILGGDQVAAFAYVTPASGVVVTPLTNFAVRDRAAGTLSAFNTSVGTGKKLERMRSNPRVAAGFHTREHSFSGRPEYVLVQGTATLSDPDPRYFDSLGDDARRFGGPLGSGRFWDWWLRDWHTRVGIGIAVERVLVWPNLECRGAAEVHGTPLPGEPASQRPPARGTGPRIDHRRAARQAAKLPNALLGWLGADGFPVVAPVKVAGADERGILLDPPPGIVPAGARRAGLTAHRFARHTYGQTLRKHTGWLEVDDRGVVYAPHTQSAYRFPASRILFMLIAGGATRWFLRGARRDAVAATYGQRPSRA